MRKSWLKAFVVTGIGLLVAGTASVASAGTVLNCDFNTGFTAGSLWGQGSWGSSKYGSTPGGAGDSWLSNPNIVADPVNAANQVVQLYGDCSGGAVHGSGLGVDVAVNNTNDITFIQSAYFTGDKAQSTVMSLLRTSGGNEWGGNVSFGNYGYYYVQNDNGPIDAGLAAGMVTWSIWDPTVTDAHSGGPDMHSLLVPKNTWTTASITFHLATQTADMTVTYMNGETPVVQQLLGVSAPYLSSGIVNGQTRYDLYVDGEYNSTSNILMDNISITQAPEPASLCLLALGGLLVARRRQA